MRQELASRFGVNGLLMKKYLVVAFLFAVAGLSTAGAQTFTAKVRIECRRNDFDHFNIF